MITSSGNTILGADNKASVASIMTTVETLNKEKNHIPYEILFTVREEIGGGCELFPFQIIDAKKGFVFDCAKPIGGIVLQSPYIINFQVNFTGAPAHTSTPNLGKNALIPVIQALKSIRIGIIDRRKTMLNIGLINGGNGLNIIPYYIEIAGEIRSYEYMLFKNCRKKIEDIFTQEAKKTRITLSFTTNGYCPGYKHKTTSPFIRKVKKLYQTLNIKPVYYQYSGVSDANILNKAGIEMVNLIGWSRKSAHL